MRNAQPVPQPMPKHLSDTTARSAQLGWTHHALPAALGDCRAARFTLGDGLVLARSFYHPQRDLVEESVNTDTARTLVITLGLSGESGYVACDGTTLRFGAGNTTLAAFSGSHGERRYAAGQPVRQLRLLLSGDALDRYVGTELSERLTTVRGVRQLDHYRSSPASLAQARRLAHPPPGRATDALDLHIGMLSLAAMELRHLAPEPQAEPRHSDEDLIRLERARDLLASHMDRNLTLAYLAGAVGLNEFKLKQGFRDVFGTSPQRMLLELRMRRAFALLETGCQVAQAGYQVGYAHPSNFSAAFSRFFGRSPKSIFGRRS